MIEFRFAEIDDLNLLVSLRLEFLGALPSSDNYLQLRTNIEEYFKHKVLSGECTAILAEYESSIIGTGIMFYYDSVPSINNIEGKNAYVTSMYVIEHYRRKNIGSTILIKLIEKARLDNYNTIMLNASDIGRKLYEKHGFVDIENGMICKKLYD
jgi:GNAT superfamily N-acetyltransferase